MRPPLWQLSVDALILFHSFMFSHFARDLYSFYSETSPVSKRRSSRPKSSICVALIDSHPSRRSGGEISAIFLDNSSPMIHFVSEITARAASSACFKSFRLAIFITASRNSFLVFILQPPFLKKSPIIKFSQTPLKECNQAQKGYLDLQNC